MKAYLGRRYRFSASHRLHSDAFNAQQNREIYGKCNNPHGHGHNYTLDVLLSGQVNRYGMVCDLAELDEFAKREVVQRFDVANLNLDRAFENVVPTTENLGVLIHRRLREKWGATFPGEWPALEKVRIAETERNIFEVRT